MKPKVKSLHIYPVKSCRVQDVESLFLEPMGPIGDRRAMIVDENGRFLTQRSHGRLAQIGALFSDPALELKIGHSKTRVKWSADRQKCQIWNDHVDLVVAEQTTNTALSIFLEKEVKLVRMDGLSQRHTSGTWAESDVSLSDGYPILVTNSASLQALSVVAGINLSMQQFRPNIVIDHQEAWAEDGWQTIKVGDAEIELVKPCTRCQITTLDPETGQVAFPEIMRAMIAHRSSADRRIKGVLFGWNGIIRKGGRVINGDTVEVIGRRQPWPLKMKSPAQGGAEID